MHRLEIETASWQIAARARASPVGAVVGGPSRAIPPLPVAAPRLHNVLRPETDPLLAAPLLRPCATPFSCSRRPSSAHMPTAIAIHILALRPRQTVAAKVPMALSRRRLGLSLALTALRLVVPLPVDRRLPSPAVANGLPLRKA